MGSSPPFCCKLASAIWKSFFVIGLPSAGICLRMAGRKEDRQFLARHARPRTDAARIDMHERNCGCRIIADAAAFADQRRITKLLRGNIREVDVGGLPGDVLASLRLPTARAPQRTNWSSRSGGRRSDAPASSSPSSSCISQIRSTSLGSISMVMFRRQSRMKWFSFFIRFGNIFAIALVDDGDVVLGVDVVKSDRPFLVRQSRRRTMREALEWQVRTWQRCANSAHGRQEKCPKFPLDRS